MTSSRTTTISRVKYLYSLWGSPIPRVLATIKCYPSLWTITDLRIDDVPFGATAEVFAVMSVSLPALKEISITSYKPLDFHAFFSPHARYKLKSLTIFPLPFHEAFVHACRTLPPDDDGLVPQLPCFAHLTALEIPSMLVPIDSPTIYPELSMYRLDALTHLKLHLPSWQDVRKLLKFQMLSTRLVAFSVHLEGECEDPPKAWPTHVLTGPVSLPRLKFLEMDETHLEYGAPLVVSSRDPIFSWSE